jgi:hypothetical protein
MKRIRHNPEQIIRKLKTAEQLIAQGKTVADICSFGGLSGHLPPLASAVRRDAG